MVNKVYINPETSKTWTDTGGDYAFDLGGLAADGVRASTYGDLGAAPRSEWFRWQLIIDGFDTAPVVGETVNVYISLSDDATVFDGDVSGTDGASSTVVLPNLKYLGTATVQTTTTTDELVVSGIARIPARYVVAVVHNNTADALASSGDAHKFILTPIPAEVQ